MNLFIDNYNTKLSIENNMLKAVTEERIEQISFMDLDSINILKPVLISSSLIVKASEHQIPILFYAANNRVEAIIWSKRYNNIAELRKQQVYFSDSASVVEWIKKLLATKLNQQIKNVQWLTDRVPAAKDELLVINDQISSQLEKLNLLTNYTAIRGWEGNIARLYWKAMSKGMQKHVLFETRDKRQPKDQFNKCLNYLYGVLYGIVEASLLMQGLDPYIGMMHIIRHSKPVLSYDHIEPFRPWIDKLLCELFMQKIIGDQQFEDQTSLLTLACRRMLVEKFFERMNERTMLNKKKIKRIDHIHYLTTIFVQYIRGDETVQFDFL